MVLSVLLIIPLGIYNIVAIGGDDTIKITNFQNYFTENSFAISGGICATWFVFVIFMGRLPWSIRIKWAILNAVVLWPFLAMSIHIFAENDLEQHAFSKPGIRQNVTYPVVRKSMHSGRGTQYFAHVRSSGRHSSSEVRISQADYVRLGELNGELSAGMFCASFTTETAGKVSRILWPLFKELPTGKIKKCPDQLVKSLIAQDVEADRTHIIVPNCAEANASNVKLAKDLDEVHMAHPQYPVRKPPYCTHGEAYDFDTGKPIPKDHRFSTQWISVQP